MKFSNLKELSEFVYDKLLHNTLDEERGQRIWVCAFYYGSELYHPQYAVDKDVKVIVSGVHSKEYYTRMFDRFSFMVGEMSCDVSLTSFNDLESNLLMELEYNIDVDKVVVVDGAPSGRHTQVLNTLNTATEITLGNKSQIRKELSAKCSNSFVKAKKKLTVQKDYDRYVSLKSLFHSIRIAGFACRYAKSGSIDPSEYLELYEEIVRDYRSHNDEEMLELINTKYKKLYNDTMSRFRLYYPK